MSIYDAVKGVMVDHKHKIEFTQWAVICGISSLVYSEYISKIHQKTVPNHQIIVPSIKTVQNILSQDGEFLQYLSNHLIEDIANDDLFKKYADAPGFILFKQSHIEILKTVFDLYMLPNVSKYIPEVISKKFGINTTNKQVMREDGDVPLFNTISLIGGEGYKFIKDQVILHLLIYVPTIKRSVGCPESNQSIKMTDSEILTIENDQAICPIHFTPAIFHNEKVMQLLKFVTSTVVTERDTSTDSVEVKSEADNEWVTWDISTNVFNRVSLTRLLEIDYDIAEHKPEDDPTPVNKGEDEKHEESV